MSSPSSTQHQASFITLSTPTQTYFFIFAVLHRNSDLCDAMPKVLEPPREGTYDSKKHLVEQCKAHAKQAGYGISILKTYAVKKSIVLACVCYGRPANKWRVTEQSRQRPNRISKKTGCKMSCVGEKLPDGRWSLRIRHGGHNHPSDLPSSVPVSGIPPRPLSSVSEMSATNFRGLHAIGTE